MIHVIQEAGHLGGAVEKVATHVLHAHEHAALFRDAAHLAQRAHGVVPGEGKGRVRLLHPGDDQDRLGPIGGGHAAHPRGQVDGAAAHGLVLGAQVIAPEKGRGHRGRRQAVAPQRGLDPLLVRQERLDAVGPLVHHQLHPVDAHPGDLPGHAVVEAPGHFPAVDRPQVHSDFHMHDLLASDRLIRRAPARQYIMCSR